MNIINNKQEALYSLKQLAFSTCDYRVLQALPYAICALEHEISVEQEIDIMIQNILSKDNILPQKTKVKVKILPYNITSSFTGFKKTQTTIHPLNARCDKENQYSDDYEIDYDFDYNF